MRRPWRISAVVLFAGAILLGGAVGEKLLALNDEARDNLKVYTELIGVAHDKFGGEVKYRDLVYASIQGMLRTLDPHTSFLSREAYDHMRERQQSSFYGLGIFVGMRDGKLTVITPIDGTPAARLGMRAGDVISMIEGQATDKMTIDEAVAMLKGPKGTKVNVTLVRPGLEEPFDLNITRAEIPQTTVQYAYMLEDKTGYMQIRDFSRSTGAEVARALGSLREAGMERLLLDLRNNAGGLLDQAIEVADQFVPGESKIVETRGRIRSSYNAYYSSGVYEELGMPVVVLVNGGSASAAEILAGAIQDHDVGLVIGEATWGKGLVQTVYTLPYGAGLALTTARYYTPAGRLIQRDYTSYWDYYTKYDASVTAESLEKRAQEEEVFYTDLGRKVFGGGGITPDYQVKPLELTPTMQLLLGRSAFFTFAVDLQSKTPVESEDWVPSDETLAALRKWVADEGLVTPEDFDAEMADPEVREYIVSRLRFEVFNTAFGLEAGHRALSATDGQIKRAVELFPDAESLLRRRQALEAEPEKGQPPKGVQTAAKQ